MYCRVILAARKQFSYHVRMLLTKHNNKKKPPSNSDLPPSGAYFMPRTFNASVSSPSLIIVVFVFDLFAEERAVRRDFETDFLASDDYFG